ncbi:MAG: DNA-binding protein [Alphaproteobacteria bacterium]|nr:DNA-binding protein [Alphaproteobacteria bacterium]
MNKAEFIADVAERTHEPKAKVAELVDAVFDALTDAMRKGDEVRLPSFGVFEAVRTAPRKARNPQTNEMVDVPAATRPRFRPGKALKDAIDTPA